MKKKYITEKLQGIGRYGISDYLSAICTRFKELEELYSADGFINLRIEISSEDHDMEFFLFGDRLETDKEFEARKKAEIKRQMRIKELKENEKETEYKEYLKLKNKFEKEDLK